MEFFNINMLLQYIWPMVTVAQIVACSIALRRIGGTGPVLMMVGTVLSLVVTIYSQYWNLAMDFAYDSEEMIISMAAQQALGIVGRVLFLIGLLLMVQRAPVVRSATERTSLKF